MTTKTEVKHTPKTLSDGSKVCQIDDCLCNGNEINLKQARTPLPWVTIEDSFETESVGMKYWKSKIGANTPLCPASANGLNKEAAEANAAFIVRAVNNHDALVEACRAAHKLIDSSYAPDIPKVMQMLEAALKQAGEAI